VVDIQEGLLRKRGISKISLPLQWEHYEKREKKGQFGFSKERWSGNQKKLSKV